MEYRFTAKLWQYDGKAAWVFATLPKKLGGELKALTSGLYAGFGSIKVSARLGDVTWNTSVFPYSTSHSYLLPIKKDIRTKASVSIGDTCIITIVVRDIDSL